MCQIDNLPPLRDVLKKHGINAIRSLGQNFLLDLNLTLKIARAAGDLENHTIIEVGPGPGGLTRALLHAGAKKVIAIERDYRAIAALQEISVAYPGRLEILEADALKIDMGSIAREQDGPVKLIANLPYNIGTPLLTGWLTTEPWPPWFSSMTLMFQKEVALRICANPAEDQFGRLGVLANWRCYTSVAFDVPREAFSPPPKVTSSIVHLEPRLKPVPCTAAVLERLTAAAFGQRRKMLRSSLKKIFFHAEDTLKSLNIEPTLRAEALDIEGFVALANALETEEQTS